MKPINKKSLIILTMMLIFSLPAFSQSKKLNQIEIKSSIQCEMCVDRLNKMFADFWAVKSVSYQIDKQMISLVYNKKKTTPEAIRRKISETGYDADRVNADVKAYMALPECCKKGVHIPEKKFNKQ